MSIEGEASGEMMCTVYQLGLMDYSQAWRLQEVLLERRIKAQIPDTLLLLEHPPTLTIGKSGKLEHLLVGREELLREGMSLFFTDRGGQITYHGPGQLVGYPIMDLRTRGADAHQYVHHLEEVIIKTLKDFSLEASRKEGFVGVWVGEKKIAAIGVRIKRWVTMHGFALNVNPNLYHFSFINPCGIIDKGVTSICRLLGREVPIDLVVRRLVDRFSEVFNTAIQWASGAP